MLVEEWTMTRIEVNSSFGLGFDRVASPVDVYDENGRPLGRFVPYIATDDQCPLSEEELQRRTAKARANPGVGKTFPEILKRLREQ